MLQSACLVINPITVDNFAVLLNCTRVDRASDFMMAPDLKLFIQVGWTEALLSIAWSTRAQLIFLPFRFPVVLYLLSPRLCFFIVYLRPKVTLHFSVLNISILILLLSKWNIAISSQHLPKHSSRKTTYKCKITFSCYLCFHEKHKNSIFSQTFRLTNNLNMLY